MLTNDDDTTCEEELEEFLDFLVQGGVIRYSLLEGSEGESFNRCGKVLSVRWFVGQAEHWLKEKFQKVEEGDTLVLATQARSYIISSTLDKAWPPASARAA
jgi:hypothetical protein